MKKLIFAGSFMLFNIVSFAQRYSSERSYDIIGLPEGDEIGDSLKKAIPLLLIGFIIAYIFMWSKKAQSANNSSSQNIGCLGIIIMAIGAFFLLPLLAWVEYIFVNIATVGFAIFIVGIIIFIIYSALKKK